jgi:hypothetical protein
MNASFSGSLHDSHSGDRGKVPFTVELTSGSLWFGADGYGDFSSQEGCGHPVMIEQYEGQLWVVVWGDINSEEPTARIPLVGARETERRAE